MDNFLPPQRRLPSGSPPSSCQNPPAPNAGRSGFARLKTAFALPVLSLLLTLGASFNSVAQTADGYNFVASAGTFTPLVGGTSAGINSDDTGSSSIALNGSTTGTFNFIFEGITYTTITASSNGVMSLGGTVGSNATNGLTSGTPTSTPCSPMGRP